MPAHTYIHKYIHTPYWLWFSAEPRLKHGMVMIRDDHVSQVFLDPGAHGHATSLRHVVISGVAVEKLEVSLLQDCSQYPDAPALGTAMQHGARPLSQVSESHGTPLCQHPTAREGLAGSMLCSPMTGEECRGPRAWPSTCRNHSPRRLTVQVWMEEPPPLGWEQGPHHSACHSRRGSKHPFLTMGRGF